MSVLRITQEDVCKYSLYQFLSPHAGDGSEIIYTITPNVDVGLFQGEKYLYITINPKLKIMLTLKLSSTFIKDREFKMWQLFLNLIIDTDKSAPNLPSKYVTAWYHGENII